MYTKAVGTKFHTDGRLRHSPGNTVISKCDGIEPLYSELLWAQAHFDKLPSRHKFAFLPPSSFHMTVFELLCDQVRDAAHWSSLTDVESQSVHETCKLVTQRLQQTIPTFTLPEPHFVMFHDMGDFQPHLVRKDAPSLCRA